MRTNKLFRKILCMVCALLFCFTALVGCGGGGNGGGQGGGPTPPSTDSKAKDISDREIYDGGTGMDDGQLNIYRWNFGGLNSARKKNSEIYKKMYSKAGMPLYADNASAGDWQAQLGVMFGTQTLPDIFVSMGPETPQSYKEMIEEGVLIPISDYVDATTYPNIYKQLKKYDFLAANVSYSQGKHWSIPVSHTLEHTLYIRKDWVDNLNKPAKLTAILTEELGHAPSAQELNDNRFVYPTTMLEFYRLCRAFTLYDPDDNGLHDTFGYTCGAGENFFSDCWIFEAFGAGYQRMVTVGDRYESSWSNINDRAALSFYNSMIYAQYPSGYTRSDNITCGYFDNTWFENDTNGKQDHFANSKCGMMEAHAWYNTILKSWIAANPKDSMTKYTIEEAAEKIDLIAPPAGPDGKYGINSNPRFWTVTCLNAGMSDEEFRAALNLLDYMLSDEGVDLMTNGIEDVNYTANNLYPKTDIRHYESLMGKDDATGFNYELSAFDTAAEAASMTSWSTGYFSPYANNADKIIAAMNRAKDYVRYPEYPFVQPDSYVQLWETLEDYAEEEFYKIVKDKSCYSAFDDKHLTSYSQWLTPNSYMQNRWNTFATSYGSKGGTTMVNDYNAYIINNRDSLLKATFD